MTKVERTQTLCGGQQVGKDMMGSERARVLLASCGSPEPPEEETGDTPASSHQGNAAATAFNLKLRDELPHQG